MDQNNPNDPNAGQQAPGGTTPVMPTDQPSTFPMPAPTPVPTLPTDQPAPAAPMGEPSAPAVPETPGAAPEPAPITDGNNGGNPTGGNPGGMGGM